ncbi:MAG: ribosome-associated translation inhibitor RaiA [Sphingomicrobium sp.]
MDIRVAGHQVETGEALQDHAASRMEEITGKYFARSVGASVTFGRGPHDDFTCDIVAPVAQGIVLKASNRAREATTAFNGAADRIEKQLRRYAKRLRGHKAEQAPPFVDNAGYTVLASTPRDTEDETASPAIVAETRVDIPESSVGDAVMLMDLRNTNALMFLNSATGAYNMIYRREDGNIGWVEPRPD